jgi:hypothetical protein
VYDAETSEPIEDVRIHVSGWDEINDEYFHESTNADTAGYYEFHTPPGDFWLDVFEDGYYDYDERITIPDNH